MDDASELPTDLGLNVEYIDERASLLGSDTRERRTAEPTTSPEESDSDDQPDTPLPEEPEYTQSDYLSAPTRWYHVNRSWRKICRRVARRRTLLSGEAKTQSTILDTPIAAEVQRFASFVRSMPMSYHSYEGRWVRQDDHWGRVADAYRVQKPARPKARWVPQTRRSRRTPSPNRSETATLPTRSPTRSDEWRDPRIRQSAQMSSPRQRTAPRPTRHRHHNRHADRSDRTTSRPVRTRKDEQRDTSARQSDSASSPRRRTAPQPSQHRYQIRHRDRADATRNRVPSPEDPAQTHMPSITTQRWLDETDDQNPLLDHAGLRSLGGPTATWTMDPFPIRTRDSQGITGTVKSEADELLFTGRRHEHSSGGRR